MGTAGGDGGFLESLRNFLVTSHNHFRALTVKNARLFVRRWKGSLLMLVTPLLGVIVLWGAAHAVRNAERPPVPQTGSLTDRPATKVPSLLEMANTAGQVTFGQKLLFSPDVPFTRAVMKGVAANEELDATPMGFNDIEGAGTWWFQNLWKDTPLAYVEFFTTDVNTTAYVIHGDIDDTYLPDSNNWYPLSETLKPSYVRFNHYQLALQRAVDTSIIETISGSGPGTVKLESSVATFAQYYQGVESRGGDTTSSRRVLDGLTPVIVFTSLMIPFIISVQLLMHEKQVKVMGMMRVVGLKEGAYWLSWFVALALPPIVYSLPCILLGMATGVSLFSRTSFFVLYFTYVVSSCGLNAMACAVSAPFAKPRFAYGIAFFVVVAGLALGLVFGIGTIASFSIYDAANPLSAVTRPTFTDMLLYDPYTGKHGLLVFLELLPPFHFLRILDVVTATTSDSYYADSNYNTVTVPGGHFGWDEFNHGRVIETCCDSRGNDYSYRSGSPARNLALLVADCVLYMAIAWYLAQVSDTDNGTPKRWYFLVTPSYWGFRAGGAIVEGDTLAKVRDESLRTGSIRLHKVSKTYKDSTALKELTMELRAGEVFCLLGQNGAGKTTTINMITGQTAPTHGKAFVRGLDVETEMDAIRPLIGLCPQHDVLWPDLTAAEHLRFYARFRGVPSARIEPEIRTLLMKVGLARRFKSRAGTFSGGMKRRLSFAIACIGSPPIIVLDEPTTGLDPMALRSVWRLINDLKQSRVVVHTTHSMDEADALADRVAMLSKGSLRAFGTPIFLKNRFGRGYQGNLVCPEKHTQRLREIVTKHLPNAQVLSDAAGSLSLSIPRSAAATDVPAFFHVVDEHDVDRGGELVTEWGISASTLEEVFLRLAMEHSEVNEEIEGDAASALALQGAGAAGGALVDATCRLCKSRPAEDVVLYTAHGIPVLVQGFVCRPCSGPPKGEIAPAGAQQGDEGMSKTPLLIEGIGGSDNDDGNTKGKGEAKGEAVTENKNKDKTESKSDAMVPIAAAGSINNPGSSSSSSSSSSSIGHGVNGKETDESPAPAHTAVEVGTKTEWTKQASFGAPRQLRALLGRSWSLKVKQRKTNVCQIAMPLVTIGILWALKLSGILSVPEPKVPSKADCKSYSISQDLCDPNQFAQVFGQTPRWINITYSRRDTDKQMSMPDYRYLEYQCRGIRGCNSVPEGLETGKIIYSDSENGFFQRVVIPKLPFLNSSAYGPVSWVLLPEFQRVKSPEALDEFMINAELANVNDPSCKSCQEGGRLNATLTMERTKSLFPSAGIKVVTTGKSGIASPDKRSLSYSHLTYSDNFQGGDNNGWKYLAVPYSSATSNFNGDMVTPTGYDLTSEMMANAIHSSLLRANLNLDPDSPAEWLANIATGFGRVPVKRISDSNSGAGDQVISLIGTLLYSFATVFVFPTFVQAAVIEREKVLPMMRVYGLKMHKYWGAMYLFNITVAALQTLVILIFALGAGIAPVGGTVGPHLSKHPGAFLMLCLCWNHALVGMAILGCALFTKGRSAVLVSYAFIILSVVGGVVLVSLSSSPRPTFGMSLFPPFGFISGINVLLLDGGRAGTVGSVTSAISGSSATGGAGGDGSYSAVGGATVASAAMFISGLACALFGALITELTSQASPLRRWIARHRQGGGNGPARSKGGKGKKKAGYGSIGDPEENGLEVPFVVSGDGENNKGYGGDSRSAAAMPVPGNEDEDEDVAAERARAEQGDPSAHSVCLRRLRRVFRSEDGSEHVAVSNLSLAIGKSECLCLLGPNGAGKTTTFSMLIGNLRATSGQAWIAGHDIMLSDPQESRVGVVEQFDCHWEELSVEEHLRFFARLAGVEPASEQAIVQRTAEMVTLDGDSFQKAAGSLSGGQQRLLSLGVASVHDPEVLFLDEPTTGLDANMRRTAWKVIARLKQRSACLVSTHAMAEAESLGDRIAILTAGRLACIGTSLHLKARFGDGYFLSLAASTADGAGEAVERFIAENVPSARLHKNVAGVFSYSIPRDSAVSISGLFDEISRPENAWFIAEWSFSQASLDTVFHKIAEGHDDDHRDQ